MFERELKAFQEKKSKRQKLIVIYGPTASGKTDMSIEIAKMLQTEIISTDSRQIFRHMDIGTGKITQEQMQGIMHHGIDIIFPDESFSVGDFVKYADPIMQKLWDQNKIPMLVGGTGLYIDSMIFERNAPTISRDMKLREQLENLSTPELYQKLQAIDPEYARELHPQNRPYIERAIEVKMLTGKSKSEFRAVPKLKYDVLFLHAGYKCPEYDGTSEFIFSPEYRAWLYKRINARVEQMFKQGMLREIQMLLDRGYNFDDFGMNAIGYREFEPYISGEISIEQLQSLVAQHSRNYAKRQLTWFKKYQNFF